MRHVQRFLIPFGAVGALVVGGACTPTATAVSTACDNTPAFTSTGPITNPALTEISGIESGLRNPSIWWVHNDGGHPNAIHAIDSTGATRATVTLTGAVNIDWEDISINTGSAPGSGVLFVGDIGDNSWNRREITVYRFPEPAVPTTGPAVAITVPAVDALRFTYPDGARDAEALAVDSATGDLVLVSKAGNGGTANVYRAPANAAAGSTTVLTKTRTISLPTGRANAITALDATLSSKSVALRTYGAFRLYPRKAGEPLSAAFSSAPCIVPISTEGQGESIGFDDGGRTIVTVSEGSNQKVRRTAAP